MGRYKAAVYFGSEGNMSQPLASGMTDYPDIDSPSDERSLRFQSRDFTDTDSELNAIQSKPNVSVGGTTGMTCMELSPRFASGIAGSKLVGLKVNPDLKGSVAGTLTSDVRCLECKFDGGTGRTIDGKMYILHAMTANAATVTGGCFVIGVDAAGGGGTGWTGFLRASASGAGGVIVSANGMTAKSPESDTEAGYISIYVGTTRYEVPFYAIA